MAIGKPVQDVALPFNTVYNITQDVSGWDSVTVQTVSPMTGSIYVYGTNDGGSQLGVTQGNASLAINFNPIQATNLSTGTATLVISAAGSYKVPVNNQFLRLQGNPTTGATITNVYKLLLFNEKTG